ncbi:MAG: hypothetical protein KW806_01690, partial [Candidatus Yanofskybacteria bacterium]|nr:hypothetical protein [Candidatus Yanofskybacteria bacterium]
MRSTFRTLFDIKPVDSTGAVDVTKMQSLAPRIDLRSKKIQREIQLVVRRQAQRTASPVAKPKSLGRSEVLAELQEAINAPVNHRAALARWGAELKDSPAIPEREYHPPTNKSDPLYDRILKEMRNPLPPVESAIMVSEPEPQPEPQSAPMGPEITPVLANAWEQQPVLEDWYYAAPPT